MASVREQQKLRLGSLGRRIARAQRRIADAAECGRWDQVHQKRRRLGNLQSKLAVLEADIAAGQVRLCFGSRRLWRKQRHLAENGYSSHEEWLGDWRNARSDEFFVLGSRDETAGCQLCVATVADDGVWCGRRRYWSRSRRISSSSSRIRTSALSRSRNRAACSLSARSRWSS